MVLRVISGLISFSLCFVVVVFFTDGFPFLYMRETSRDSRLEGLSEVFICFHLLDL